MKKIILVLAIMLFLSGCELKKNEPKETTGGDSNVFTTLKEAMEKKLTLKCEYVDEDGQKTITYLKNGVAKLEGTIGEDKNYEGLLKDGYFYLWDKKTMEGMKLDIAKEGADGSITMKGKQVKNMDEVINVLEEEKQNCVTIPETNGMFDVPSEVKFNNE